MFRYETRSDYRRREQEQVRDRRRTPGDQQRQRDRDLRPDKRQQGGDPGGSEVIRVIMIIMMKTVNICLREIERREERCGGK